MVHSEHDTNFYALDKQVRVCVYKCFLERGVLILVLIVRLHL